MLRFLTAGESHGQAEIAILEGIPSGLSLGKSDIQRDLDKRRSGAGRGGRGTIEPDQVEILSGVRNGLTIGSPICLMIDNLDFENWKNRKIPKVTNPRPGHADLSGYLKYGFSDIRSVLERASARETVMRVAVGAVCRKLLSEFGIRIASHTVRIGSVKVNASNTGFTVVENVHVDDPQTRCADPDKRKPMAQEILMAVKSRDSLGGVIEVIGVNVPPGLGSYVHFDRRLDGVIAQLMMSIPSVKAVEIGDGINNSGCKGSEVHDAICFSHGTFKRDTNKAGGIEGGISNGEDIICRIYLKPVSSLGKPLKTIDVESLKQTEALIERSDVCVVPRAGVVAESMLGFALSVTFLEKFGSDSLEEIKTNYRNYLKRIKK